MNYADPTDSMALARMEYPLAQAALSVGDRVRVTVSYDVCGNDPMSSSTLGVDIDIDLFLYNDTTDTYVYGSQSVDDNNEGFDVILDEVDDDGDYVLVISRPESQKTHCGNKNMTLWWAGRWGASW